MQYQADKIRQRNAHEVIQIEPEGAPDVFNGPAQGVVAQKQQGRPEQVQSAVQKGIGDEPPDLAPQDQIRVKGQQLVESLAGIHAVDEIDDAGADGYIKHQIGDALIAVAEAEPVKFTP